MNDALFLAQKRRELVEFEQFLDDRIDEMLGASAKDVTPHERHQLRGLLRYYAKKPHPFRACVRDNMKRFGPGRTEAICATLKDIIRGTTKWRGKHNPRDKGVAPGILTQDRANGLLLALDELTELDLWEIMGHEMHLEEIRGSIR